MSWVVALAMRHPYLHLGGYMRRWWLMPRWAMQPDENGYPEPKPWVPFSIRIHHILREDRDPYLHTHPFNFRTIILSGSYIEENAWGRFTAYGPGSTRRASFDTLHRIDQVSKGGVWTLFIMGKKHPESWGFMVGRPSRLMHHSVYHSPNARTADAVDEDAA